MKKITHILIAIAAILFLISGMTASTNATPVGVPVISDEIAPVINPSHFDATEITTNGTVSNNSINAQKNNVDDAEGTQNVFVGNIGSAESIITGVNLAAVNLTTVGSTNLSLSNNMIEEAIHGQMTTPNIGTTGFDGSVSIVGAIYPWSGFAAVDEEMVGRILSTSLSEAYHHTILGEDALTGQVIAAMTDDGRLIVYGNGNVAFTPLDLQQAYGVAPSIQWTYLTAAVKDPVDISYALQ